MIESHTAILERQASVHGAYATEPYETSWAREAIFFLREHGSADDPGSHVVAVQISPDGMLWCDEGTTVSVATGRLTHVKVAHFGGWLRLVGEVPDAAHISLSIQLVLKG